MDRKTDPFSSIKSTFIISVLYVKVMDLKKYFGELFFILNLNSSGSWFEDIFCSSGLQDDHMILILQIPTHGEKENYMLPSET